MHKPSNRNTIKLNTAGISHYLLPIAIVLVVAIAGVYSLVASHACSVSGSLSHPANTGCGDHSSLSHPANGSAPAKKPAIKPPQVTSKTPHLTKTPPTSGPSGSSNSSGDGAVNTGAAYANPINPSSNSPTPEAAPYVSYTPAKPKPQPSGDILVTTYYNDPSVSKQSGKDQRLGGVKVEVNRVGGSNNCNNRKSDTASTNAVSWRKSGGVKVYVKGTAHYLRCDTGKYQVKLIGKKGYIAASQSSQTVTLSNHETEKVYFVLIKQSTKGTGGGSLSL